MTDDIGTRRERAQRNRRLIYYAVLGLVGGIVGYVFAMYEADDPQWAGGAIPPTVAIVLAIVTLAAMVGGCIFMKRRVDEVEMRHNLYAASYAAFTVLVGYPSWYILWKGGLVDEPSHIWMFLILYGVMVVTYLIRKYR